MRTRRAWIVVVAMLLWGFLLAVAAQGCGDAIAVECPRLDGTGRYDAWCYECLDHMELTGCHICGWDPQLGKSFACAYCPDYDVETQPAKICSPDTGLDAGTDSAITDGGATGCAGDCLPVPPSGWFGPDLLWIGPVDMEPSCPSHAPVVAYQGHADLIAPPPVACTACTCSLPTGACTPPLHLATSSVPCAQGGLGVRYFDPPPAWDASCTDHDAIAAGELCNGVPCAVSLLADALVLTETGCTPGTAVPVGIAEPPSWSTTVLECSGSTSPASACNDPGLTCAPSAAMALGFVTCISREGDRPCPPTYPDKHLAYADVDDQTSCAPCACGVPDSSCKAILLAFADDACTQKPALLALDLTAAAPSCGDLPDAGVALGSKQIEALAYQPGPCVPSGGAPSGTVEPAAPSTFCCLS